MAIPITYRTVSFAIEETKEKQLQEAVKAKKDAAAGFGEVDWHTSSIEDIQNRLSTTAAQGLSRDQVAQKLKQYGPNKPSPPPSDLLSRICMCS